MRIALSGAVIVGGLIISPLVLIAYEADTFIDAIIRALKMPIMPFIVIVKMLKWVGNYVDKREKIGEYLDAEDAGSARRMNDIRTQEAKRIVDALEKMHNNKGKGDVVEMDPKLREQMIKFFIDEKRDMGSIIDTANELEKEAKKKKKSIQQGSQSLNTYNLM